MPLRIVAPNATPAELAFGVEVAEQVFDAAGIGAREAWNAYTGGVAGDAWSTWFLAENCALDAVLGENVDAPGHLRLSDDE